MSTINANTRGGLTVDRESLHTSDGYRRQIDSLRQLQQDKPMSTEELRKAVDRIEPLAKSKQVPDWMNNHKAWKRITQALRDQEAEIAGYRLEEQRRIAEAVALASRAAKAEALLRECLHYLDPPQLHDRITAHLGGENNG